MTCATCGDPVSTDSPEYELGAVRGRLCSDCSVGLQAAVTGWMSDRMAALAAERLRVAEQAKRDLRAREREHRARQRLEDERLRQEVRQANETAKRMRALRREAYPAGFYLSGSRAIEAGLEAAMGAEAAE